MSIKKVFLSLFTIVKLFFIALTFTIFITTIYFSLQAIKKPVKINKNQAAEAELGVTLYTSPTSIQTYKGETFTVDIDINTQMESISQADVVVNFDRELLQAESVIIRNFLPKTVRKNINNEGIISFVVETESEQGINGAGTLASITFVSLKSGSANINFSSLSQISSSDKSANILSTSSGSVIDIIDIPAVRSLSDDHQGSTVVIYAYGTKAENQFPALDLIINNESKAIFYGISDQLKKYTYKNDSKITPDQIKIKFINDLNDKENHQDRNLMIDKIEIDGIAYETEDQTTYSVGTWAPGGCSSGYKQSEWLYCNGEFQYYP